MINLPLIIVAATYAQAHYEAARLQKKRGEWVYASDTRAIIGRRGNDILFCGEFWETLLCQNYTPDEICSLYGFRRVPFDFGYKE